MDVALAVLVMMLGVCMWMGPILAFFFGAGLCACHIICHIISFIIAAKHPPTNPSNTRSYHIILYHNS